MNVKLCSELHIQVKARLTEARDGRIVKQSADERERADGTSAG